MKPADPHSNGSGTDNQHTGRSRLGSLLFRRPRLFDARGAVHEQVAIERRLSCVPHQSPIPLDRTHHTHPLLHIFHAGRVLEVTIPHLEAGSDARSVSDLSSLLHAACDLTGLKQKLFMTALRHALTAMKVSPFFFWFPTLPPRSSPLAFT